MIKFFKTFIILLLFPLCFFIPAILLAICVNKFPLITFVVLSGGGCAVLAYTSVRIENTIKEQEAQKREFYNYWRGRRE